MEQTLFAISDAAEAGRTTGKIVAVVLALAGVAKCYAISKRPTTNRKCAFGLMFLCVTFVLSGLSQLLLSKLPLAAASYVGAINGILIFGCMVTSVVLAIMGLVEYRRTPGQFVQGRAQAIWTLVVSGLLIVFGAIGFKAGQAKRYAASNQSLPGETLALSEYNFRFSAPGKPWIKADAAKLNRDARMAFIRSDPEVIFLIIAEPVGAFLNRDALQELVISRLKSAASSARLVHRTDETINGLTGTRLHTEAQVGRYHFAYAHWLVVTNGWAYQLITYGPQSSAVTVLQEAFQMSRRFSLIDFARQGQLPGRAEHTDWVSTNFLMRVRIANSAWVPWPEAHRLAPGSSFGALLGNDVALVVAPLWTFDLRPHASMVTEAFLQILGFDVEGKEKLSEREIGWGTLKGIEARFARTGENRTDYVYRARVAQGRGYGYFACAWTVRGNPNVEQVLSDALGRVEIDAPPVTPPAPTQYTADELRSHQFLLNGIGLAYFNRGQFEASTAYFKAALDLPAERKPPTSLANLVEASIRANKMSDALQALEAHASMVSTQRTLQANQAFLQGRLGRTQEAQTNYMRLFADGYADEAHFREFASLLAQTEGPERAIAAMEKFFETHDSVDLRLSYAAFLRQARKSDEAIAVLRAQRAKHPFNANVALGLAESYLQALRFTEALELSQQLIKEQSEPAYAWFLKGRSELGLKWYREAKDSLEVAAKKAPQSEDIQTYLRHVSAFLGEGANSAVREPISPVEVPSELLTALPPAPADYGADTGAYYDRAITAISFQRGRELKTTEYLRVKTLNSVGVSSFSSLQFDYNPIVEQLYVNRLEVRRPDNTLVSTGKVSDYYIVDQATGEMATSRKVLNVPVSGLEPGFWLEAEITRRELGKAEEFTFVPHLFSRYSPVRESLLLIRGDTGAVQTASSPQLQRRPIASALCWQINDPPAFRLEPLQASIWEYLPSLWVADRTARWPALATNYLQQIEDRFALPKPLADRARELTRHATNEVDKVTLLAQFVQTNITYKAIEFGRRARIPQTLDDIQRNKYGDCKDHSLLLRQMLVAAGVPADLALVRARSPVREDLPSLDQFDHMIVHVPVKGGGRFVDCTVKTADFTSVPWGLAGRKALVLDAGNPRLVTIPDYSTNANVVRSVRALRFSTNNALRVVESIVFHGLQGSFIREALQKLPAPNRQDWIANALGVAAGDLKSAAFEGIMEIQAPLKMNLEYQLPNQFHSVGGEIIGALPVSFAERWQLLARAIDKRTSPFELTYPALLESSVTIEPPPGYRLKNDLRPDARLVNRFVTGNLAGRWTLPAPAYQTTLFQAPGRFPAADYAEYCRAMTEASAVLGPKVVFARAPRR